MLFDGRCAPSLFLLTHAPAGTLRCRDCWAEEPGDRPTFDNIVPRLDSLVHRGDIPSSMSSHGKPRGGSQKMDEADEECGSPIKRWGTAPIM